MAGKERLKPSEDRSGPGEGVNETVTVLAGLGAQLICDGSDLADGGDGVYPKIWKALPIDPIAGPTSAGIRCESNGPSKSILPASQNRIIQIGHQDSLCYRRRSYRYSHSKPAGWRPGPTEWG